MSPINLAVAAKSIVLKYISAGAGAGKTQKAIELSLKFNCLGTNVLIVVPTTALADSFSERSQGRIRSIHSNNTLHPVEEIQEVFRQQTKSMSAPVSIAITEQAFMMMNYRLGTERWVIIKDEANEPLIINEIACKDSKQDILSWFKLSPLVSNKPTSSWFNVIEFGFDKNCPKTTTIDDDIYGKLHELKQYMSNPHVEVLIDIERLDWDSPTLRYSVFIKPSLYEEFAEAYFMSANFEHTFLYQQWAKFGVQWQQVFKDLPSAPPSNRVRIHYWSDNRSWSARRRERDLEKYIKWFLSREPGKDYVYTANKADDIGLLDLPGCRMPAVCHGLNDWSGYTKFMSAASYLISNADEHIYQHYGSSTTDARGLRNTQMLYQQLMRTDLRNYSSTKPIDLYVPTLTEARELLLYLPDASIYDMNKTRDGERTGITAQLKSTWQPKFTEQDQSEPQENRYSVAWNVNQIASESYDELRLDQLFARIGGTNSILPPHILADNSVLWGSSGVMQCNKKGRPHQSKRAKTHGFLEFLCEVARAPETSCPDAHLKTKEERNQIKQRLPLFITGQLADGDRFYAKNIQGNNDILAFDFDDSTITNRQISTIFKGAEHLIYTSLSQQPNAPLRRIRVVVACNRTMTVREHEKLMKYFYSQIKDLKLEHTGLDEQCRKPERKFYMPHYESQINHVYKNKELLDIDRILTRIPHEPVVQAPELYDLDLTFPTGSTSSQYDALIATCEAKINDLRPGNRSNLAMSIAGYMKRLPEQEKLRLYHMIEAKGVEKSALQQVKRYAELSIK